MTPILGLLATLAYFAIGLACVWATVRWTPKGQWQIDGLFNLAILWPLVAVVAIPFWLFTLAIEDAEKRRDAARGESS